MEINITEVTDMGQLSAIVYKDFGPGTDLREGKVLAGDFQIGNDGFSLNNSYTVKKYTSTITGMQAILFVKNDESGNPTNEYVLAFRGTETNSLLDIGTDTIIGLANYNLQFNDAKAFV